MPDILLFIKDAIGIWSLFLALVVAYIFRKHTLSHIMLYAALIGLLDRGVLLFANPIARAFIQSFYAQVSASDTIMAIVLSCLASALVTALFALVIGILIKRRQ